MWVKIILREDVSPVAFPDYSTPITNNQPLKFLLFTKLAQQLLISILYLRPPPQQLMQIVHFFFSPRIRFLHIQDSIMSNSQGQVQASSEDTASSLPPEAIAFATRMYDAARQGNTDLLQQAIDAGLPPNLTNEKGDTLVRFSSS